MGFVKDLDSLARQFMWAGSLLSLKWSLVNWDTICSPCKFGSRVNAIVFD